MAKKTIRQQVIADMAAQGMALVGETSGLLSFSKTSNLSRKLTALGLSEADVVVRTGARVGPRANDGSELLIFRK